MKITYLFEDRIPDNLQKLVIQYINNAGLDFKKVSYSAPQNELHNAFNSSEAVLCAPGRFIKPELYRDNKQLKLFQLWSSGYDKFDISTPKENGIYVCNNGGANAISVAEHTILLMLSQYKNIIDAHHRTVNGKWAGNSHGMDMYMLHRKTVGVVGLGNIGSEVARRLAAFGCDILIYDIDKKNPSDYGFSFKQVSLSELALNSDIITLHLHHNEQTEKIINGDIFALMKTNAVLINVSRAGLVDQKAFRDALAGKKIFGAGLDVYPIEPTTNSDPILKHPRVVASPHMAGSTIDVYHEALSVCMQNIARIQRGEEPMHVVNGVSKC